MKLVDLIEKKSGDSKDFIINCACPSSYGPEYDKYDEGCAKRTCKECWNQEIARNSFDDQEE